MEFRKNKITLYLQPSVGDWTSFKPHILEMTSKNTSMLRGAHKMSDNDLYSAMLCFLPLFEQYLDTLQKNIETPIALHTLSVQQLTYPQILKQLDHPVAQFKVRGHQGDHISICFDSTIAGLLINRSVGSASSIDTSKALTEIEIKILETCTSPDIHLLAQTDPGTSLELVSSSGILFDQTVPETAILTVLEALIEMESGKKGRLFLIMTNKSVKEILMRSQASKGLFNAGKLHQIDTEKVGLDVSADLGTTTISAKELFDLGEGDVLVLDKTIHTLLPFTVAGHLHLKGQPGIKNDRLAIQVLNTGKGNVERIRSSAPEEIITEDPSAVIDDTERSSGEFSGDLLSAQAEETEENVLSEDSGQEFAEGFPGFDFSGSQTQSPAEEG